MTRAAAFLASASLVVALPAAASDAATARSLTIRLFDAGHSIEQIAAAASVRYDDILAIVRPR